MSVAEAPAVEEKPETPARRWPRRVPRTIGRLGWRKARCLFGLTTGRVGTTTLAKALQLSPEIEAFHEPPPRDERTYRDAYRDVYADPDAVRRLFVECRAGAIGAFRRRGKVYAECNNFQFAAPVVADLLPRSVFLFLHRDPAEYVRSGMRRGWYGGHPWDSRRITPRPDDPAAAEWDAWGPFEKIAWFWTACNRQFLDTVNGLPPERSVTIPFAELVAGSGEALLPVFDKLGVDRPPASELNAVYADRHNAQRKGDFAHPSKWTGDQRETLRRIAGPVMDALGYGEAAS